MWGQTDYSAIYQMQEQIRLQNEAKAKADAEAKAKAEADYAANPGTAFNPKHSPTATPVGPDGRPMSPGFVSIGDDATGLLKQPYQLQNNLNTQALDQLRTETLNQGPSKWSQLQRQMQGDDIAASTASQVQQAKSGLASAGGLRSGAGERLAQSGMRQGLMGRQSMQANLANQDEQNRLTNLRALPGMELQAAQYGQDTNKYNIDGAKTEMLQRRAFDSNQYNESMRAWAAQKTAAATPSSGKK